VQAAIHLGRDYLLPHARGAFGLMGADQRLEDARQVSEWLRRECESSEYSESAPPCFSRRDIHQGCRRRFPSVDDLDPVLELLVRHGHIRPLPTSGQSGRGHKSPVYEVNRALCASVKREAPRTHCTQRTQSNGSSPGGESAQCLVADDDSEIF
jgi:hypothetical protein